MTRIGKRIRLERRALGLSQQRLAVRAGMSLNGISRIEQGDVTDPRLSTLVGIADALNTTVGELVGEPVPSAALSPDQDQAIKRHAAAKKVVGFLEVDRYLKQKVHNLGPYAWTHIDWASRQERLEEVLDALHELHAMPEKAKS